MTDYEKLTKNALVVLVKNLSYQYEKDEEKLKLLTGCAGFGDCDPMNGSCVECSYNDEAQWIKCREFREKLHVALTEKMEKEKSAAKRKKDVEFYF